MRILNFGSLNIDEFYTVPHFVSAGETLAPDGYRRSAGGKGLNQSVALARAGADVAHAGCVGDDGGFLVSFLASSGVNVARVATTETATGRAIIQVVPSGQNCILLFGGANRAVTGEHIAAAFAGFGKGDLLLVQNETSALPALFAAADARGMAVAWNPSPYEKGLEDLAVPGLRYLILNEIEAAAMSGEDAPDAQLAALRARYPGAGILLTLGSRGSRYAGPEGEFTARAYPVRAVDTTGAGDTYTGYFLASIAAGAPVPDAMDLAARASAVAVTRPGAAPSIPTLDEVKTARF